MDRLKYVKLENEDGSYTSSIPLAVDSNYVDVNGVSLTSELSNKATISDINNLQNQILSLASGSPLAASSVSNMIDTTKIYVNTTDGYWYYYNGINWEIGGVYQNVVSELGEFLCELELVTTIDTTIANDYSINILQTPDINYSLRVTCDKAIYVTTELRQGSRFGFGKTDLFTANETKTYDLLRNGYYTTLRVSYAGGTPTLAITEIVMKRKVKYNNDYDNSIKTYEEIFNKKYNILNGLYITTSGTYSSNGNYSIKEFIVNEGEQFEINVKDSSNIASISYWNNQESMISYLSGNQKGIFTIPSNCKILRVCGISSSVQYINKITKIENASNHTDNDSLLFKDRVTYTNNNITISDITDYGFSLARTDSSRSGYIIISWNNKYKNVLSKIYSRCKMTAVDDCELIISLFSANADRVRNSIYLKAGETYDLYMCNDNNTNDLLYYQITIYGGSLTINYLILGDEKELFYNKETYNSLRIINDSITIDRKGTEDFQGIQEAITFAQEKYDVVNVPVSIIVKNGIYTVSPTNSYPYAAINKGANRISIIGETRDGVIINCTNTSLIQSKVLDIGGPCTIENLTINSLNDGTYTVENDMQHNCYCIHNDTAFASNLKYKTIVKNCYLYSECHSPVGAGLQNNQTQIYENVECISDGIKSAGALYIHASSNASAENMGVIIDNCKCISKDETKAITLPNVSGSLPYTSIPTTIQRTIGVTNGSSITDNDFKTDHNLTSDSVLNNVNDWNY